MSKIVLLLFSPALILALMISGNPHKLEYFHYTAALQLIVMALGIWAFIRWFRKKRRKSDTEN